MFITVEDFVIAFFYHIVFMSIVATVIGSAIFILRKVLRKKFSPSCIYLMWMVFIFSLIIPVVIPSKFSIYNYIDLDVSETLNSDYNAFEVYNYEEIKNHLVVTDTNNNMDMLFSKYLRRAFSYSWLVLALVKIYGVFDIKRILLDNIGDEEFEDERIYKILEKCKKKLNINKDIKVIKQSFIREPSTFGIFDVRILLTENMLILSDDSIEDIFMHELSHYKRKDNVMNFAILFIKAIHWFNPFLNKMFEAMKVDLEYATDEMAVASFDADARKDYCKTLVKVAGLQSKKIEVVVGISSEKQSLINRLELISLREDFDKHYKITMIFTFLIIINLCLIFFPTSYAKNGFPDVYLKLENGESVELSDSEELLCLKLNENSTVKLDINERNVKHILCNRIDLNSHISLGEALNENSFITSKGENLYRFTVFYDKGRTKDYEVKIVVE